jgi:glutamate-1-semialdehyde 2,1-aminomutase
MSQVAPLGPVYQAGTLSGNPLATAAGLAALEHLDDDAYARLERTATALADGLAAAVPDAVVPRVGTLVGLFFSAGEPADYEQAKRTDTARFARFFHGMLDRGVALAPGAYEVLFPGLAHTDELVEEVVAAAAAAAASSEVG